MAEGILIRLVEGIGEPADGASPPPASEVSSAGTGASGGWPPTDEARDTALEAGIDISNHRARPLTRELLAQSDLILVMQPHHAAAAAALLPEAASRIRTLTAYAGEEGEGVTDPIGLGPDGYRRVFRRLTDLLQRALPRIVQEARSKPLSDRRNG
jgi:protein-tyrosine phosphatase